MTGIRFFSVKFLHWATSDFFLFATKDVFYYFCPVQGMCMYEGSSFHTKLCLTWISVHTHFLQQWGSMWHSPPPWLQLCTGRRGLPFSRDFIPAQSRHLTLLVALTIHASWLFMHVLIFTSLRVIKVLPCLVLSWVLTEIFKRFSHIPKSQTTVVNSTWGTSRRYHCIFPTLWHFYSPKGSPTMTHKGFADIIWVTSTQDFISQCDKFKNKHWQ